METIYTKLDRALNPTRMRYPYFFGAALWISWVISLLLGTGNTDAAGRLIGTDFAAFYTAGKIVLQGQSPDLYDLDLARQVQQSLYAAPSDNFNPYLNPPFYAWLFVPFALIPYPISPILWMGLNLFLLWVSFKLISSKRLSSVLGLSLTWMPAFAAISFGQNAFLNLVLLCLVYILWRKDRTWEAGFVSGLLLYKPQLLIGIGLLWLLDYKKSWRALLGLAVTGLALFSLSFALMPEATVAYVTYAQKIASNLMKVEGFPIWSAHGVQSFWIGIFPHQETLTTILYLVSALVGVYYCIRLWKTTHNPGLRYSAAICLTVWITPYIMVYDWVLLLLPALLFWQELNLIHKQLKVIYAFVWVVMLISSGLTFGQWNLFGRAVQISIPAILVAFILIYRAIQKNQPEKNQVNAG